MYITTSGAFPRNHLFPKASDEVKPPGLGRAKALGGQLRDNPDPLDFSLVDIPRYLSLTGMISV